MYSDKKKSLLHRWKEANSLSRQWGLAVSLTILPLLLAVGYSIYSLDGQNKAQHELVSSVIRVNQLGIQIKEDLSEVERLARQAHILQDERLNTLSEDKSRKLQDKLNQLDELLLSQKSRARINQMITLLGVNPVNSAVSNEEQMVQLENKFDLASNLSAAIKTDTQHYIEDALVTSEQEFENKKMYLLWIGALILPMTAILLAFFSYRISLPLKSLGSAIRRLGQGAIYEPVTVEGPGDIVALVSRLEWMREKLLDLEKQKNVFLRHVTHELKTPLAAIMEAASLLSDEVPGPVNEKQQNVLGILERNAKILLEQIQQLLNYNEARSVIKPSQSEISVRELISGVVVRQNDSAQARKINIVLQGNEIILSLDAMRIEMILSNLLSNAINYSPSGGRVDVRWGADPEIFWFEIEDNGPGIADSEREAIYQPFYQGCATRIGSTKGSGLGLSIAKECTEIMNGKIQLTSAPNKGSRFKVMIPIKDSI